MRVCNKALKPGTDPPASAWAALCLQKIWTLYKGLSSVVAVGTTKSWGPRCWVGPWGWLCQGVRTGGTGKGTA